MCTRRPTQLISRTTFQTICGSGQFCFVSIYASFGKLERWQRKSSGSASQWARNRYFSHVPTGSRRSDRHLLMDRPILGTKFDGCIPGEMCQIDQSKCANVRKRSCSPCRIVQWYALCTYSYSIVFCSKVKTSVEVPTLVFSLSHHLYYIRTKTRAWRFAWAHVLHVERGEKVVIMFPPPPMKAVIELTLNKRFVCTVKN